MDQNTTKTVLIIYYSVSGHTQLMAQAIASGVEMHPHVEAKIRTVPPISADTEQTSDPIPESGAPYVTLEDLAQCDGLALGSPTRFGNMAAPLKYFIDQTGGLWYNGDLVDKPFGVFTSTASLHGGQESTLLSMALPCLHQGMIYIGLPYPKTALNETKRGGTPYGPTHWSENNQQHALATAEKELCISLGKRLAHFSFLLSAQPQ